MDFVRKYPLFTSNNENSVLPPPISKRTPLLILFKYFLQLLKHNFASSSEDIISTDRPVLLFTDQDGHPRVD